MTKQIFFNKHRLNCKCAWCSIDDKHYIGVQGDKRIHSDMHVLDTWLDRIKITKSFIQWQEKNKDSMVGTSICAISNKQHDKWLDKNVLLNKVLSKKHLNLKPYKGKNK